ncbi:hypothetical protein GEMRC1_005397 [Eukaryota sp. GEM-RC1]
MTNRTVKSYFTVVTLVDDGIECQRRECSFQGCSTTFSLRTSDNVLKKHLKNDHSLFSSDNKKQVALDSNAPIAVPPSLNLELSPGQINYVVSLIEDFVTHDHLPFTFAESSILRALLTFISPKIAQPCRKTVRSRIIQNYTHQKSHIISLLKKPNAINLTLDLWSSRQRLPFLGITCHFIEDFQFHSIVLNVDLFEHPHTGDQVNAVVTKVLQEFGIAEKVLTVTTDNAANIGKAFNIPRSFLSTVHQDFCLCHMLVLVI